MTTSSESMKPCIVWDSIWNLEKVTKGDISRVIGITTGLAKQGIQVSLVALNAGKMQIDGAKVIQVPNRRYIYLRTRTLGRILNRLYGHSLYGYDGMKNAQHVAGFVARVLDPVEQYSLYHVRNAYLAIELKRLQPHKPLVYTAIPRYLYTGAIKDKALDQKALDVADKTIALTEGWKQYIIDTFNVRGREIMVAPVCAANTNDIPRADDLPEHIFKDRKIIGYFGVLQSNRGIDTLIEAIPEVKKVVDNVSVIIAGRSFHNHEKELKALARDLGVYKDTYLAGEIPHSLVPGYLKKCHVLVDLKCGEGHLRHAWDISIPIKCVEYIVLGKPVVATRDGGVELLFGKSYPYLVEPGNKTQLVQSLVKLLTDDEEAATIGMLNKRISMNYTYEAVANKLTSLYSQICL